ncbi:hypothetical protein N1I87_16430 [Bacillus sp. FSL W8-0102]|jgi:hypothetical protein|uniref:hypothetical protein n=1 Tax=Bacillus sp. FSL W8-0102 TaxID=2978205 RepID=UPI000307A6E5|nr:hypothetical protein [Bacillus smithii]
MKHRHITEEMVPLLTLSLSLDFINLFINILQILGIGEGTIKTGQETYRSPAEISPPGFSLLY